MVPHTSIENKRAFAGFLDAAGDKGMWKYAQDVGKTYRFDWMSAKWTPPLLIKMQQDRESTSFRGNVTEERGRLGGCRERCPGDSVQAFMDAIWGIVWPAFLFPP
jgi:hypothetical protein